MPKPLPPISRRDFLAGSLAAGAASLWLPRLAWAEDARTDPNRFVLMADTHVMGNRDEAKRGVKPWENFARAAGGMLALDTRPAGAIVAGDCAALKGEPSDYAVLAEEVEPLVKAGVPMHFALGNHDHRENFYAAFGDARPQGDPPVPGKHVTIVEAPHANWFVLDSLQKTDHVPGRLGEAQLAWLAKELDARADKPALMVAHHNPDDNPKSSALQDTKALFEVLAPRKQAKAYIFGHTHRWQLSERDGIQLINLPTLAWLFDKKQPRAWIDAKLQADGVTLTVNGLPPEHPKHGQSVELTWRV